LSTIDARVAQRQQEHGRPDWGAWALAAHEAAVAPRLAELVSASGVPERWAVECGPGAGAGRTRLFPGSWFLLWVEALGGDAACEAAAWVAAALELAHNATLVHDDLLDGHQTRRGQATLLAEAGPGAALLAGDWLYAAAFLALGRAGPEARVRDSGMRLAEAAARVAAGQLLDEPSSWARVRPEDGWAHWLRVCDGKLAVGNAGAGMAADWTGRRELAGPLMELVAEFSVVSQVINDFGDALGFEGYHRLARSGRRTAEEARRKPTLPLLWGADGPGADAARALLPRARAEIERRRRRVLAELARFELAPDARALLVDFFERPSLDAFTT
jgi:geranylgeranyl diphosphate synthase, type I